jgi:hypothetical protein
LYFLVEEEEATRDNCKLQKHEVILACAIEKPVVHQGVCFFEAQPDVITPVPCAIGLFKQKQTKEKAGASGAVL